MEAFKTGVQNRESILLLEQKVAQLFIITPDALTGITGVSAAGDATYAALQQYPVGGLVYFENNLQSYEQISEMLHNVQQYSMEISGLPLFLAVSKVSLFALVLF